MPHETNKPSSLVQAGDAYLLSHHHSAEATQHVVEAYAAFDHLVSYAMERCLEQLEVEDAVILLFPSPHRQFGYPPPEGA